MATTYLSPKEGMMTTMVLPLFSGRLPTVNAAIERQYDRTTDMTTEGERGADDKWMGRRR